MNVNINILIVDDEIAMDKLIRKIFRKEQQEESYVFKYLNSADAAYAYLLKNDDVNIILLDINMPGQMDGLALLKKVKDINPLIKTIMISAYGDMDRSRIAMQEGAFDFIQKPLDQEDLKFSVKRAVDYVAETNKVTQLLLEVDVLNYMVKNDVINYIKSESLENKNRESRKEKASVLVTSIHCPDEFFANDNSDKLIRSLNQYYTVVTRNIRRFDGYIDTFVGTLGFGVLVGVNSVINIFRVALEIQDQISEINKLRRLEDLPCMGISIGVDYGEIIIGNLGSVDPIRLEHTITGAPVSRAVSLAINGLENQILFYKKPSFDFVFHEYNCNELDNMSNICQLIDNK